MSGELARGDRARSFLALASAALTALSVAACATVPSRGIATGQLSPNNTLALPDGAELRLAETRGTVVVLAFFTTYCPASRAVLHAADQLRARDPAVGVTVSSPSAKGTAPPL